MSRTRRYPLAHGAAIGLSLLLCWGAAAQTPSFDTAIREAVERAVDVRHRLHEHPELSNREFKTAALVESRLRALGLDEVRSKVAHTGVVGVLRGAHPGPTIAIRADMDALPVVEQTDLPFKSTVKTTFLGKEVGVMHACGHDIHTAVVLGAAETLAKLRQQLSGTILFIFQPAEEGAPQGEEGGAELMLKEGLFEEFHPQAVFGLHSNPELEVGQIGYTPGPALAAVD
ncbi:MAG: amidohydrolase, partial [Planctomycetota bacterium]